MTRSNSDYASENLINGTNGYVDDYKSSKYGGPSMLRERNRSQRREKRINDAPDRYGKGIGSGFVGGGSGANHIGVTGGSSSSSVGGGGKPAAAAIINSSQFGSTVEIDPNKNKTAAHSIPSTQVPSTINATYPRRNTGPRVRNVRNVPPIPRNINRSRSQTGADLVPTSANEAAGANASATAVVSAAVAAPSLVSPSTASQTDEFQGDNVYYYDYRNPVDLNNLQLTQTPQTAPPLFQQSYYFNTPYPVYADPERTKKALQAQIEYYFSEENLQRDFFLRRKMDEQGFLPISLIASFHRVQALTQDVALVVDSLANSTTVEVVGGVKVRTRFNPERWPLVCNPCGCVD